MNAIALHPTPIGTQPRVVQYQDGCLVSPSRSGYKTEANDMLAYSMIQLQVLASPERHQPEP